MLGNNEPILDHEKSVIAVSVFFAALSTRYQICEVARDAASSSRSAKASRVRLGQSPAGTPTEQGPSSARKKKPAA
jgi:hypothetical protein